jgi:hypothetical protein
MSFIERLTKEREELSDKVEKIFTFVVSEKFNELDEQNKMLLFHQERHMRNYLGVLDQRIELLSDK